MKKLLPLILLLLVNHAGFAVNGETAGRRAAQQKAAAVLGAKTRLELAAVGEGEQPAYYIFNNVETDKGFVIVAGDDGDNDILGYSDSGRYDAANMPPQLSFWLQCYEEQLALVRRGEAAPYRSATNYSTIEPLVQTHWDQQAPYNRWNPISPITNTQFPNTGCVATAMAQILKYWASDKQTADIPSYSYKLNAGGKVYTVNVDGLSPTTFNYSLMRNYYSSDDIDAAAYEVARLMAYCGRAAQMVYMSTTATAVTRGSYLSQYFGFNEHQVTEQREYYSAAEWDSLLYDELRAGRPIMYSGARQDASREQSGHAFVVDGYKDGLFHINWGWSGFFDGYFKLSECNPYGGGAGAGTGRDGYSFRQIAITRLTPGEVEEGHPRGGTAPAEGGLVVDAFDYEGERRIGNEMTLRFNITNQGTAYYNRAFLFVDGKLTTGAGVMIDPGESDEVLLHIKPERAGMLSLKLCGENDGSLEFWEDSLRIKSNRDPQLTFGTPVVAHLQDERYYNISGQTFEATVSITNDDTEIFDDTLTFVINRYVPYSGDISWDFKGNGVPEGEESFDMLIPAGDTQEVTVSFSGLTIGQRYWLQVGYYQPSAKRKVYQKISEEYTILPGESGIEAVRSDGAATDQEQYFDLLGRRVIKPRKGGIYIRRKTTIYRH